ncbi:MAG TPA: hypothetical protein DEQ74_03220 [Wolbachia sp.]|uniref:ankyrin repeat domain-containing protein n=1 Tax=Wolbachia endosymbiont of Pentalonia nigronervosa TaxID=1301914 RepID=UPI000EC6A150|nr:ankyrin repeat domain-containing protein [Wolbachia endosymbiont of Pentalonia nigronervosa]MBD0391163.1 hypothetical protein [Wolbachia endosymbiont of Pentalonia nigronervosa]HCE59812.1 hypothetical protein [Wolbachia sp.]
MLKRYLESTLNQHGYSHVQQGTHNPSYCNDEIMYEELFNTIKGNSLEEEKLKNIEELFKKELEPDINFKNKSGDTFLHVAMRKKEAKVIKLLIENGAKTDIQNDNGVTPLDIARNKGITRLLAINLQASAKEQSFNEKDRFIRVTVGKARSDSFAEFLNTDEGQKMYNATCKNKAVNRMSSILHGAGSKAKDAFQGLYDLWFNEEGNKRPPLKTLENNGVTLARISSILSRVVQQDEIIQESMSHLKNVSNIGKAVSEPHRSHVSPLNKRKRSEEDYVNAKMFKKEDTYVNSVQTTEQRQSSSYMEENKVGQQGLNRDVDYRALLDQIFYDLWSDEKGNERQGSGRGMDYSTLLDQILYNLWSDEEGDKGRGLDKDINDYTLLDQMLHDPWFDEKGDINQQGTAVGQEPSTSMLNIEFYQLNNKFL